MEVTRCQSLLSDHDIISQASIACKHGFFLDDLLVCNKHGFKILKLKQDAVPKSILTYDHDTIKSADLAHSCEGWFQYALEKGYFQTIEEVFPRHWWHVDFEEINYGADIAGLQKQLDDLALVNMLDQEFVDALASGGAAYQEIASQVSAESTRAQNAESSISAAYQAADAAQSTTLLGGASGSADTLGKLEGLVSTEVTRAQAAENSLSAAYQAADAAQSTTLLGGASSSGDTLAKLEALISAEEARAQGVESDIQGAVSSDFNSLKKQEDKFVTESAATVSNFAADRVRLANLEATYSDTQVDAVCDTKIAALVNSAPQDLNTLKELADALASDASFSTTINTALSARVLSTTYTSEQQAQDALIAGKQDTITGTTTWVGATIAANKLDLSSKQDVIGDGDLTIARTSGLQSELDSKQAEIGSTTAWEGAVIPAAKLDLSSKQDVIGDGDLTIARTSGLQTALDSKQAEIGSTTAWEGAVIPAAKLDLSSKQDVIGDGDLSIARTSGLQTALDSKQAEITGITAWLGATIPETKLDLSSKQDVIGDGDLTVARTSGLQAALDAKALDSAVVKKTGQQSIVQAGAGAVLTLENSTGDAAILSCTGADGSISLSGGNVLTCDRPGAMYIRSTDGASNIAIQSRGSTKFVCDDQVRSKTDFSVENQKKVKFYEQTSNGTNTISLRAPAAVSSDVSFTLPGVDGSNGQVLKTDGSGNLSFATQSAGLSASADETISGNWTFEEAVVFQEPIMRTPMQALDTVWAYNYNADNANIITADHSAYLYGAAGANDDDTYLRLSSAAPVGTRIVIYSYSTHSSKNKTRIGTQSSEHTIWKENSTTHQNGWTGKSSSETMTSDNAKWVLLSCNDKRIFTKITSDTWTY